MHRSYRFFKMSRMVGLTGLAGGGSGTSADTPDTADAAEESGTADADESGAADVPDTADTADAADESGTLAESDDTATLSNSELKIEQSSSSCSGVRPAGVTTRGGVYEDGGSWGRAREGMTVSAPTELTRTINGESCSEFRHDIWSELLRKLAVSESWREFGRDVCREDGRDAGEVTET